MKGLDGQSTTECKWCHTKMKFHDSTGSLKNHLRRKHPSIDLDPLQTSGEGSSGDAPQPPSKQPKIYQCMRPPMTSERQEKIIQLITNHIVNEMRPLRTVECESFQKIFEYLEPSFQMPSRRTITRRVETEYDVGKKKLISMLTDCTHISLTADGWTSLKMESFLGITAHYVDSDYHLKSFVLCVKPLSERHTGVHIAQWIEDALEEYSISPQKIVALVTDSGSNMVLAKKLLQEKHGWIGMACLSHTLQLCLNAGFKLDEVANLLSATRKLVQHFRRSERATTALKNKCTEMNVGQHKLIHDVPTRWNSTYEMLKRLSEMQWPIVAVLSQSDPQVGAQRRGDTLDLKPSDWEALKELVPVLQPFSQATEILGAETYVTMSLKVPVIKSLKRQTSAARLNGVPCVVAFRESVAAELNRRFSDNMTDASHKATALDPRYKMKMLSSADMTQLKASLELEMTVLLQERRSGEEPSQPHYDIAVATNVPIQEGESPQSALSKLMSCAYDSAESDSSGDADTVSEELKRYLKARALPGSHKIRPLQDSAHKIRPLRLRDVTRLGPE